MKVQSSDLSQRIATASVFGNLARAFSPAGVLQGSALLWLTVFFLGQLAFFYYLMAFYGVTVVTNQLAMWNVFEQFGATPYIAGDTRGNFAFGSHALGAGIIAIAGGLQLVPYIRRRFPRFHRWNGRSFLVTCIALTLSGFYLVWVRHEPPSTFNDLKTTFNGILILVCSYFVMRRVLDKDIKNHSRWALRLLLVANGQWFLRLGVMCYMVLGNIFGEASFGDRFFVFWDFTAFVLPLVALQAYFFAKDRGSSAVRVMTAALITLLTLLMVVGVIAFGAVQLKIINGEPLEF